MPRKQSIWFRLGYALERARGGAPVAEKTLRGLADRAPRKKRTPEAAPAGWPSADALIATGTTAAVAKVLDAWHPRGKTGVSRLIRAGASGAAAALIVDLVRPLIRGEKVPPIDQGTGERLLAGIGQGLVYGGVFEPRVPGPALVKGALYGSAEYAVDPVGGLSRLLGPHAPQRRLPLVAHLLEELDPHDRPLLEQVIFGVALALLYGSSRSSNGIRPDRDDG